MNVDDPDDWDTGDKVFFNAENSIPNNFILDTETGLITAKNLTSGEQELRFTVFDRKQQQQARSTMRIRTHDLTFNNLLNCGSISISGLSSQAFISEYHRPTERRIVSMKTKLEQTLQNILSISDLVIISISDSTSGSFFLPNFDLYFTSKSSRFTSDYLNMALAAKVEILRDQLPVSEKKYKLSKFFFSLGVFL